MPEIKKYIYGIINSNQELTEATAKSLAKEAGMTASKTIKTIPYQDISAVVSDSENTDFSHMRRDVLARNLVRHQKVIEAIGKRMPDYAIIPLKLGTIAKDEDEVGLILSKGYQLFKDIFSKVAGKIEIDVACIWSDFSSLLKETGEEGRIKEFKQSLLANSKGISVDDRMKVGLMVQKAVERKNEDCAGEVLNSLKTVSQDVKIHQCMDDKMIANYAFLIDKTKVGYFYKKVEELDGYFQGQLDFKCVGPLPPYSFYTLEIKKMEYEEVDWARKELGLDELVSKKEIEKAYKGKSLLTHPDRNPDTPGKKEEFDKVNKAHNIVNDYSLAGGEVPGGERISFKAEDFGKNSILVRVKK
ncbi:MAG: GvpL/GvpF family gas vesicle protein [Candidatus Omnitrophica bacterium]|nr:GvpL/GvpF family gas vesicle protein [Candidatus Omnitrophota bacterium]